MCKPINTASFRTDGITIYSAKQVFLPRKVFPLIPMAPKSDSAEGIVLNFVNEIDGSFGSIDFLLIRLISWEILRLCLNQNRPLNSQNVADSLQKFNLKKAAIQKALDSLADGGKISFKEYGKQKIYMARQDQFDIPNSEDLNQMKEQNSKLQEQLAERKKAISEVEAGNQVESRGQGTAIKFDTRSDTSQADPTGKRGKSDVKQMEDKLTKLRQGVTLVSPEQRQVVEKMYMETMNQWRRRKRMFKDVWSAITENSPKNPNEFKEELGLEYDEDCGVSLQSFDELGHGVNKRAKRK
ncbi:hypothetical protein SASPL_125617 [Salvia splendens]|uniref:Homologous-pairing protein 2 homolog n=1 Tax=Salvia splendens TaxID=180675 RepID=A0A8X8ZPB2_SALSN|nr:hypothetical protein SASPL_125617 [Salvia splendens]